VSVAIAPRLFAIVAVPPSCVTFAHIPTALALEERCENVQNAENLVVKIALTFKTVLIASAMYVKLLARLYLLRRLLEWRSKLSAVACVTSRWQVKGVFAPKL